MIMLMVTHNHNVVDRVFVLAGFGLACYLGVRFTMMMNSGVGAAIAIITMITDISGILTHYKWKSKTFPVRS